ncbi:hypothetical protein [Echinicola sp. 20G]|uniref:hypothetical protein n=1 Tax=Echinicola sp. 20G TaxID=2781961 RepID=UPI00190FF75A|nr:hypothetical protein [Echinicola sp. 20G]
MNYFAKNLLRGGVFAAAMVAAFAFTTPESITNQYGEESGVWYDVTGINPSQSTYTCDEQEDAECLFDAPNPGANPISPDEDREFVKHGELPEAE